VTVTHSPLYNGLFLSALHNEKNEIVATPDALENKLVREALQLTGFEKGIVISSAADISFGTGFGSSGAFVVGLLHALYVLRGEKPAPEFLADRASSIFLERLGTAEGKQDPYLAARGGFSCFELDRENRVSFLPLAIRDETKKEFEARSLFFYTGTIRQSAKILDDHQKKATAGDDAVLRYRHRVKEIGRKIKDAFETGDLDRFGELLDNHWRAKKESSPGVSVGVIDEAYEKARGAGMLGGKILGAGGGGFFQAFVKDGQQNSVRRVFQDAGLQEIDMKISEKGTEIIHFV
jgi:D-glycero-alpha-D-manno-heptose-7-phosphate kinase